MNHKNRHHSPLLATCLAALLLCPARALEPQPPPDPHHILRSVESTLPGQPLQMTGELTVLDRRGRTRHTRHLEIQLDFSRETSHARYILYDAFGEQLEQLDITRTPRQPPTYRHHDAQRDKTTLITDPTRPIENLHFNWADISLDFLWWQHAELLGEETKLNRPCYVLRVYPPDDQAAYAHVDLWIDQSTRALLQADGYSPEALVKRMQVKNLIRVNELWTPGDIEVTSFPSRHKTRLRIRDVHLEEEPPPGNNEPEA